MLLAIRIFVEINLFIFFGHDNSVFKKVRPIKIVLLF